jgi:hypothetical protein
MAEGKAPGPKRIVLVGHCGADSYALKSAVSRMVPGSEIVFAPDTRSVEAELARADLLLINRTLDGDYDQHEGVDIVRQVAARGERAPALMLISNYSESQAEAVKAGARPGFGKRDLYSDEAKRRVLDAIGSP